MTAVMRQIITLTTIPPRFGKTGETLQTLLSQRLPAERIELYIPRHYRRFPDWGGSLPEVPAGVTIVRVDEDLGPATKILPAARAWTGQAVDLIYVDDDRRYGPDLTRVALDLRKEHPDAALCATGFSVRNRYGYDVPDRRKPRAVQTVNPRFSLDYQFRNALADLRHRLFGGPPPLTPVKLLARSGYVDVAQGYGGVAVRPEFLDEIAHAIPPVLWAVDDVWLSGMLERRGIPIWADRRLFGVRKLEAVSEIEPLFRAVIDGAARDTADRACIDYFRKTYGIWGGVATQRT